jgi:malate synthase
MAEWCLIDNELDQQKTAVDAVRYATYQKAAELTRRLIRSPQFVDFLTVSAYEQILKEEEFGSA